MRILITTDLYTANINGVVTSVKNLISHLRKNGHEVRVLTLSEHTKSHRTETEYFIASMPIGIYPNIRMPISRGRKFQKELISWKPDIIHSQCEFFTMGYAKRISKKTGVPIVHTYHTLYEHYVKYAIPIKSLGTKILRTFIRRRLSRTTAVIAPTEKIRSHLKGYGLSAPVSVIPSGIDHNQHKPIGAEQRLTERKKLGLGDGDFVLVYVGRIAEEKNIEEIIDFYLSASRSNTKLLIVGDGPHRKALEKKCNGSENIIFTGMIPPDQVHMYYQLGDVFVNASVSETQGLTYIEALMNGIPLLCRYDSCLDGVLEPGVNGFAYTDQKEFEACLDASMVFKRQEIAAQCRKSTEKFTIEAFGESVTALYRQCLLPPSTK